MIGYTVAAIAVTECGWDRPPTSVAGARNIALPIAVEVSGHNLDPA
jgi:hypothetical protein